MNHKKELQWSLFIGSKNFSLQFLYNYTRNRPGTPFYLCRPLITIDTVSVVPTAAPTLGVKELRNTLRCHMTRYSRAPIPFYY